MSRLNRLGLPLLLVTLATAVACGDKDPPDTGSGSSTGSGGSSGDSGYRSTGRHRPGGTIVTVDWPDDKLALYVTELGRETDIDKGWTFDAFRTDGAGPAPVTSCALAGAQATEPCHPVPPGGMDLELGDEHIPGVQSRLRPEDADALTFVMSAPGMGCWVWGHDPSALSARGCKRAADRGNVLKGRVRLGEAGERRTRKRITHPLHLRSARLEVADDTIELDMSMFCSEPSWTVRSRVRGQTRVVATSTETSLELPLSAAPRCEDGGLEIQARCVLPDWMVADELLEQGKGRYAMFRGLHHCQE
jgi:hypothetical protein